MEDESVPYNHPYKAVLIPTEGEPREIVLNPIDKHLESIQQEIPHIINTLIINKESYDVSVTYDGEEEKKVTITEVLEGYCAAEPNNLPHNALASDFCGFDVKGPVIIAEYGLDADLDCICYNFTLERYKLFSKFNKILKEANTE